MNINQVRENVVNTAAKYIGVQEGTEEHKKIIDTYNSQKPLPVGYSVKYTDDWCATFVSSVVVELGYTDIIPCECSCPRMITLFQKKGIWIEDENRIPNPGDIIFYYWDDNGKGDNIGSPEHVGIVEKVSGGYVAIIEGNYSNSVKRRTLSVNGRYIRGYGVPNYASKASSNNVSNIGGARSMRLLQCIFYNNKCYKKGQYMNPTRIVVHSTGCYNTTLKRYVQPHSGQNSGMAELYPTKRTYTRAQMMQLLGDNQYDNDWNKDNLNVCVHAFIGKLADGSIASIQTLPWDMRCWGVGGGSKGSFNDCAIQFEICEDNHSSASYCKETYQEAVELCAMLCKEYDIDPDMIVGHYEAHAMGYGSNHGDPKLWWNKFGYSMDGFRADVKKAIGETKKPVVSTPSTPSTNKAMYRVRKSWADAASQVSANTVLENAKKACDEAGSGYHVFDPSGNIVYSAKVAQAIINVGDVVKLSSDAKYTSGKSVPKWVINSKIYVRKINGDNITVSVLKIGAITGVVNKKYIINNKNSITEVAKDVIAGKYGNGTARRNKLKAEGYDPDEVQKEVNRLL